MNSINDFIITPTNERYNNKINIDGKTLIINSNIEDHKMVSRHATVVSVPIACDFNIKKGDEIIIHHNIFRRWYDIRGKQRNRVNILKMIFIFVNLIKYIYIKKAIIGCLLWIDVLLCL